MARETSGDAALRELERAMDAFMATHVATASNALATGMKDLLDVDTEPVNAPDVASLQRDLKRLHWLTLVVSETRRRRGPTGIVSVGKLLLSWLQTVESSSAAAVASTATITGPSAVEAARAAEHVQQQSPLDPVASWLVAMLLKIALQDPPSSSSDLSSVERSTVDELVAVVVSRCLLSFQRSWQADEEAQRRARAESSGNLFSYLTMRKAKPKTLINSPPSAIAVCLTCTTEAGIAWGHVLGLVACLAPDVARMKLQKEVLARSTVWNATKPSDITQHPYLKHFTHIRLGLAPNKSFPSSLTSRMADAARWLRVLMPLLLKPHRSHVRSASAHLISQLLVRELYSLNRLELSVLYTSTGSDWSRCISDLHAAALRLTDCAKKKSRGRSQQHLEASSWGLRTAVLALAPGEIFTRYWREDALALLRLQSHLNQDASANGTASYNVLPSLELSFTYMMHRHLLLRDSGATTAGAPSEADCMEIINTTQAWGFFSLPRLRPQSNGTGISSFTALKTIAVPALVHVSRAMASYNMTYTVQNHLRRLLAEPIGIGDPQKLIGLEALVDMLSRPQTIENVMSFQVNQNDLLASKQMIGELVGRVLLECSTRIGHKLLTEIPVIMSKKEKLQSFDEEDEDEEHWKDPSHAVAVATFAAALALMPALYAHVSLSNEQKLLLLVRTSVNAERVVHRRAHEALLALIGPQSPHSTEPPPPGAGVVVRALTDYIIRMHVSTSMAVSDAAGAIIILRLLSVLLEPSRAETIRWESARARFEALIQVEAIAVYLLARGDDNIEAEQLLRLAALETLGVAHEARVGCCEEPAIRNSVQLPLVNRPSVWVILSDLEPELDIAFFTFRPDQAQEKHSALRRLVFDTSERHSYRWSLCLARIFRSLARRALDVTAYIWSDVADKVSKLEPVLSVTPIAVEQPSNQRDLARWRNLALFATASACPILQTQTRKTEVSSFNSETSSEPPSVSPSTMVSALVRQMACYLRSTNVGQRNAAVLVLGNSGSVALPTLLDVLARLEAEAFTTPSTTAEPDATEPPQNVMRQRGVRTAKLPKKKLLELQHARTAQFTLQWAIGRCYRLLLEPRTREQNDSDDLEPGSPIGERLRRVVSVFLAKMMTTFEETEASSDTQNPVLLMVQLDFIANLRSLLLHSNAATKPALQLPHDKLAALLLGWCGSFAKDLAEPALAVNLASGFISPGAGSRLYSHWLQHCDVYAARDGNLRFPWLWVDNQNLLLRCSSDTCSASRSVAQYVVCHRAFSALADLLRSSLRSPDGTGTWDGDSVVTWLDACFSVDGLAFQHVADLHQLAQRALHVLLELPPGSARFHHVVKRCLEKAAYEFSNAAKPDLQVARQYLQALGASIEAMSFFRSLLHQLQERADSQDMEESYLAVRLLHVLLLHVGIQIDDKLVHQHRQVALDMVAVLVCEPEDDESAATRWGLQSYYSPSLEGQIAGRLQVSVSALLASRFSVLSLRVSLAILRSMPTSSLRNREDISQHRQMLAAVLPWLAEVPLSAPKESSTKPTELLELLFSLTAVLADTCSEQLDHIWLTLAFASNGVEDSNLQEIVSFLFRQQRKNRRPSETAKTIMWWLCRWQDAAPDVLRLLLLQLPLNEPNPSDSASALDELGALVTLAGDTSCHLLQSNVSDVRALAVHLVHVSLSTLFALLGSRTVDENVFKSIAQHCHVLLHSVLPLLEAPRGLLAAALTLIRVSTSTVRKDGTLQQEEFLEAVEALATCLSTTEMKIWSELCVQELAFAISTETSAPESVESIRRPSSHEVSVRFALVAYTQLSPHFQGDVLLSVLTLLRQTLTAGDRPSRPLLLARECLSLLAMLMRTMPVSRMVLYPQVFWVSLALLTHCRQQRDSSSGCPSLHDGALELLSIIWDRPPIANHAVVREVIHCTRPAQWDSSTARNSVLMEIVRCIYADEFLESRSRAMEMLRKAVLMVPNDLLGVSRREQLVICTLSLLPALINPSDDGEAETWDDLAALWQSVGTSPEGDLMVALLQTRDLTDADSGSIASKFMAVFVPALYTLELDSNDESSFDGLKLSLEVLVACLPLPEGIPTSETPRESIIVDLNCKRCDFVFVMIEELLRDVLHRKERVWRPIPELEATLARLLRSPRSERQWKLASRVLSWIAEVTKVAGSTGSSVAPLPRRSLPCQTSSQMSAVLGRIPESDDSNVYSADTLKKNPSSRALLRILSPRSQSTTGIRKNTVNEGVNNNNEISAPPRASSKEQHELEQHGSEHEELTTPIEVESSPNS
eukprot:jgi/Phyca11/103558/e_gw1.8.500.1